MSNETRWIAHRFITIAAASLALAACGGSPKKADAPEDEPKAAKAEPKPAEPEEKKEEKPELRLSPTETITTADKAWVFNYRGSEPYEKAEEECEKKHKDKPQKLAKCLNGGRGKFVADVMEFRADESGKSTWIIYKTKGDRLIKVYSVPIEFGDEKDNVVTLKKAGKGSGNPPIMGPKAAFDVTVQSSYTIEIEDPSWGRLSYDAKIGLINK